MLSFPTAFVVLYRFLNKLQQRLKKPESPEIAHNIKICYYICTNIKIHQANGIFVFIIRLIYKQSTHRFGYFRE